ncbi:MAG: Two-component system sensor histidine kinase [uncultured Propionibacteriaceae bacterium]|uniref:histidine kinase n=1 Tax=uncultured Propionibacteriaceae bacterium TaxID=257457 RepID=A0A6J4PI35_9ACTN|nr:MAG: Two-component system sensor histidine kinase [uncultured Propionibacteriaceae bacterium]
MSLPIRVRLTVWYAALMALTIAALGTFLVLQLKTELYSEVDHQAATGSYAVLQALADEADDIDDPDDTDGNSTDPDDGTAADTAEDAAEAARDFEEAAFTALHSVEAPAAQVLTEEGQILVASGAGTSTGPLVDEAVRLEALKGNASTVTARVGPGLGQRYRVRVTAFQDRGQSRILLVGVSLRQAESDVGKLLAILLTGGPAALVVTGFGAYWLAYKALRPLGRMTSDAEAIRTDRLHERVAVPNTNDEMSQLAVTLNAMLDRIEAGVAQHRRLVADASHELRTPLAVMRTEIDVSLRSDELNPAAHEVLESTREEVDWMSRTVDNLLTLAAVDEGELELLTVPMDLQEAIEEAVSPLRSVAAAKSVTVEVAGSHREAQADPQRIHLALTNLIENAIKFTPPGGVVLVESWSRPGEVGITVSDNGPGISAQDHDRLFDRFYRVDSSRGRSNGGSGLGLAICREVALAHGGQVTVESELGKGSAFSLVLPDWRALTTADTGTTAGSSRLLPK